MINKIEILEVFEEVVELDEFLEIPIEAQLLYFHLLIKSQERGLVTNAKAIARKIGVDERWLKYLVSKTFITHENKYEYEIIGLAEYEENNE